MIPRITEKLAQKAYEIEKRLRSDPPDATGLGELFADIDDIAAALAQACRTVEFGDPAAQGGRSVNISGAWVTTTFSAPATNVIVGHTLGRVPLGLIQVQRAVFNQAVAGTGVVTFGTVAPTNLQVSLRCTAAQTATVLLF